jgi:hypothetical protein
MPARTDAKTPLQALGASPRVKPDPAPGSSTPQKSPARAPRAERRRKVSSMSSIQLIERRGALLPTRVPVMAMTWRELCVVDAPLALMGLQQGGIAGFADVTATTDHTYSTRTGPASCSPPV